MQRAGLRRDDGSVGAEVAMEYLQRLSRRRGARDHEGVVIARNGEDRSRIVSERVVKLIVIVLRLAEIVDDVAEMEDECRAICLVRAVAIHGDLIRYAEFIEVLARVGGPRIAECMKDDLSRMLDPLDDLSSMTAVGVLELQQVVVGAPRFFEAYDVLLQEILDLVEHRGVARMLGREPGRVRRRRLLAEVRLMKDRLWYPCMRVPWHGVHPSVRSDTTYTCYTAFATTE